MKLEPFASSAPEVVVSPEVLEDELRAFQAGGKLWADNAEKAKARGDEAFASYCRGMAARWERSAERIRELLGRGSAETSRGCGHAADSGEAGANVAHETANPSERRAGGAL